MVRLVYNYGEVSGHIEMACCLEEGTPLYKTLKQIPNVIICGIEENGELTKRRLDIPNAKVLDVIRALEDDIEEKPIMDKLPVGDWVTENDKYYIHMENLMREILIIDILYKWQEISW